MTTGCICDLWIHFLVERRKLVKSLGFSGFIHMRSKILSKNAFNSSSMPSSRLEAQISVLSEAFGSRRYQCCRNEHEQMNINKHDKKPNINQLRPQAVFVRERSPTLVCPFNSSHQNIFFCFLFFSFSIICIKSKKKPSRRRRNIKVRKVSNTP